MDIDDRPNKPEYLTMFYQIERYLNPTHVDKGQDMEEDSGRTKAASYPRRRGIGEGSVEPVRDDVSMFATWEEFMQLTGYLKIGRNRYPQVLFEQLGYLFHD